MHAYHMMSKHGSYSRPNIIIVDNQGNKFMQSYENVVAKYIPLTQEYEITTRLMSRTTTNYLTSFIRLCSKQIVANLEEIQGLANVRFVENVM